MIGGRQTLVLTLILGVLCMHALVLVGTAPVEGLAAGPGAPGATSGPPAHAPAAMGDTIATPAPGHEGSGHSGHDAGHGSAPSAMHHVLHLCVAILAALLVVGAAALVLRRTLRPERSGVPIGGLVRQVPRRRPPPTSVRLAQLGVLRN